MERFGKFEDESLYPGLRTEAFITRNRKGEFLWYIKVYERGVMIEEHDVPMISAYPDKDEEGNDVPMDVAPTDEANVQILNAKTEEILSATTVGRVHGEAGGVRATEGVD